MIILRFVESMSEFEVVSMRLYVSVYMALLGESEKKIEKGKTEKGKRKTRKSPRLTDTENKGEWGHIRINDG